LIGTLGLWVWFHVLPEQGLDLVEVIALGMVALLLTSSFRGSVRIIGLRIRGPERVLVIAPLADDVPQLRQLVEAPTAQTRPTEVTRGPLSITSQSGSRLSAINSATSESAPEIDGPEPEQLEALAILADPWLTEEDIGPRRRA
jgi:hypothetical protein